MKQTFRLYLLGNFRLEHANETTKLPRRKSESLLAYLVLHPKEHAREQLAALFWGDSLDEDARRALRVALTDLRKVLGADAFLGERDTLQLNPDFPLWVDAKQFSDIRLPIADSRSEIENLKSAIDLYHGDLLADVYDDWITPLREEYHTLYLNALLCLIDRACAQRDYAQVIDLGRRVLATDPANETAHQHLMRAYAAQGDRTAALDQYAACERALRDELDVAPSKELRALCDSIKQKVVSVSTAAQLTNLPKPLTSFIGREKEMEEIRQLLVDHSLVTLIGAGGSGKTRLSIELGRALVSEYRAGIWWVDLSPLSDATLVAHSVAKALGVQEQPRQSITETLVNSLQARQLLLVLDNCEHLIDACATLTQTLLAQCENVHILATSREALNIIGEQIYRVPPLALPMAEDTVMAMDLLQLASSKLQSSAAVRLFIERANSQSAGFKLNEQNAFQILRICQRLDGIPLAIELAAARVNSFSVDEIANRLNDRFRLLTGGSRAALPRQRTLQALVDWSWDLLSGAERVLMRRLAVFAGGWTLQAAEQVASERDRPDDTLELLMRLVDKSLVIAEEMRNTTRYRMLETIRQYARDRLMQANEVEATQHRHLQYFVQLAEQVEPELWHANQKDQLDQLDVERDNWRAALEWSDTEVELGLRLANALGQYWQVRGYWSEGREWLTRLLGLTPPAPSVSEARALNLAGLLAANQSDLSAARQLCQKAYALSRTLNAQREIAYALYGIGTCDYHQDRYADAETHLLAALEHFRALGDKPGMALAYGNLGGIMLDQSRLEQAREFFQSSLNTCQELGHSLGMAGALDALGAVSGVQGNSRQAIPYFEKGLAIFRAAGDKPGMIESLRGLGLAVIAQGEYETARIYMEESLGLCHQLGNREGIAGCLDQLGVICAKQNDLPTAFEHWQTSVTMLLKLNMPGRAVVPLVNMGDILRYRQDWHGAQAKYEQALTVARQVAQSHYQGVLLRRLGQVYVGQNNERQALMFFYQGLEIFRQTKSAKSILLSLYGIAHAWIIQNTKLGVPSPQRAELAARLCGVGADQLSNFDEPQELASREAALAMLSEQLGQARLETLLAEGRAVTLEQAIALALEE